MSAHSKGMHPQASAASVQSTLRKGQSHRRTAIERSSSSFSEPGVVPCSARLEKTSLTHASARRRSSRYGMPHLP